MIHSTIIINMHSTTKTTIVVILSSAVPAALAQHTLAAQGSQPMQGPMGQSSTMPQQALTSGAPMAEDPGSTSWSGIL